MELDATQALDIDYGSEEDDHNADVDRKQVPVTTSVIIISCVVYVWVC